jgi:anti-anti-sigma regulatory factor
VLGCIPSTEFYRCIKDCDKAKEFPNMKIIRYEESIYYANVDNFRYNIMKYSGIENSAAKFKETQLKLKRKSISEVEEQVFLEKKNEKISFFILKLTFLLFQRELDNPNGIQHIILDFSCVNFIDPMGIDTLIKLKNNFKSINVTLHLTCCKRCIFEAFDSHSSKDLFDYENIYPTNHDAVSLILLRKKNSTRSNSYSSSTGSESATAQMAQLKSTLQQTGTQMNDL